MCTHSAVKYRWKTNNLGGKQIAVYCKDCDRLLGWGKKAGEKSPKQLPLFVKK